MARGPQALPPQRGLGKAIRILREEMKMSGGTLAERSGVSSSWLSRIEDGQVDPSWGTIRRIASKGLGVPLECVAEVADRFEDASD